MVYKLFVDTNVYLDFLMQRGNYWRNAEAIFKLAEDGLIEVFTPASSVLNMTYVMDACKLERQEIITNAYRILSYTKLVNPDNITFEIALSSAFKDLEDAVQYYTALDIKDVNYFITSNVKDYKNAPAHLPVITPTAFINKYNNG